MTRDDAAELYIRAGELEVFRQLERDAQALDATLAVDTAFAVGPFARLRADEVLDELGKTRGAISNLWGSQEAFRAAVMHLFLNDETLGLDEVRYPSPTDHDDVEAWIEALAAVEIERGPRHLMPPENRYGLRWASWLGLVPYGIWSERIASASMHEYKLGVERYATDVVRPALDHFGLALVESVTIEDLAIALSSMVEGFWLNSSLTADDPLGRPTSIAAALATSLRLLLHGAVANRAASA